MANTFKLTLSFQTREERRRFLVYIAEGIGGSDWVYTSKVGAVDDRSMFYNRTAFDVTRVGMENKVIVDSDTDTQFNRKAEEDMVAYLFRVRFELRAELRMLGLEVNESATIFQMRTVLRNNKRS